MRSRTRGAGCSAASPWAHSPHRALTNDWACPSNSLLHAELGLEAPKPQREARSVPASRGTRSCGALPGLAQHAAFRPPQPSPSFSLPVLLAYFAPPNQPAGREAAPGRLLSSPERPGTGQSWLRGREAGKKTLQSSGRLRGSEGEEHHCWKVLIHHPPGAQARSRSVQGPANGFTAGFEHTEGFEHTKGQLSLCKTTALLLPWAQVRSQTHPQGADPRGFSIFIL